MKKAETFFASRTRILCLLAFIACSVAVYYFSSDSRLQALTVRGNYYYTSREISDRAGIDDHFRIWIPAFVIQFRLENDPMIESASVTKQGQAITLDIKEKLVLGYYLKDGQNYMLTSTGESIPIPSNEYIKNLVHFPFLSGLSDNQMQMMAEEFSSYPDYLTQDVLEKIAEILPWSESYDDNMVKMIMQDGNVVFSSIDSLHMISNYQAMLTELQGENVCLYLDGENQIIDKIACEYMYKTSEERDADRTQLKKQLESIKQSIEDAREAQENQAEEQKKKESEDAQKKTDNTQTSQQSSSEQEQNKPAEDSTGSQTQEKSTDDTAAADLSEQSESARKTEE